MQDNYVLYAQDCCPPSCASRALPLIVWGTMTRISSTFAALKRTALIPFIMGGDPDATISLALLRALPKAGADLIEIGMPFSDPMADGPLIAAAGRRALAVGATMHTTLEMVRAFRAEDMHTPIILMGYTNPVLTFGAEAFCVAAAQAGVDGLILVDLPPEEASEIGVFAAENGLDLIRLIAPTTTPERLAYVLQGARGFVYYVSIAGITGGKQADTAAVAAHVAQIRAHTDLPIAIGFGVKTPADAARMGALGDAVVVGSALVERLTQDGVDGAITFIKDLHDAL